MALLVQIIGTVTAVMKMWMFYEALWMRRDPMWAAITMIVPLGEWIYFFHSRGIPVPAQRIITKYFRKYFRRKASLDSLRYKASESPSFENQFALAQGLYDAGKYTEAISLLEKLCLQDPKSATVRLLLAKSYKRSQQHEKALPYLEELWSQNQNFSQADFTTEYADALCVLNRPEDACTVLRRACQRSNRFTFRLTLAELLSAQKNAPEARDLLTSVVNDYKFGSKLVRRIEWPSYWRARKMLRSLPQSNLQ